VQQFGKLAVAAGLMLDWSWTEEAALGRSRKFSGRRRSRSSGFSIVEMAVSLTVLLILTAIAIPSLMYSFRTYQLNDAATRVSDALKFTRYEAVRRNTQVCFLMQGGSGSPWVIGTDSNCSGTFSANERQQVIAGFAGILGSGVAPSPSAIRAKLGGAGLTPVSSSPSSIKFDARGAIRVGGSVSSTIFVFYIGSTTDAEFGYRAVVLVPSGNIQIWTAPAGGPWQQVS
jgi:Tfp pilus assembly protein FimT